MYIGNHNRKDKVDAVLKSTRYQVILRDGAKLLLRNAEGTEYVRSPSQVKKAGNERWRDLSPNQAQISPTRTILNTNPEVDNDEIEYDELDDDQDQMEIDNDSLVEAGDEEQISSKSWKVISKKNKISPESSVHMERSGRVKRIPKRFEDFIMNNVTNEKPERTEQNAVQAIPLTLQEVSFLMNIF